MFSLARLKLLALRVGVILVLSALVKPLGLYAAQVEGLYLVELPVASQSTRDLRTATREGLSTVFVRVSGNRSALQNESIKVAIANANNFTKQFQYENRVDETSGEEQLVVVLEFEQALVDGQLRSAGLPLWSDNRPSVLVWMVVEDIDGQRFVGADTAPEIVAAIMASAQRRGLVVKMPILDLEDMVAVSTEDFQRLSNHNIQTAAERYNADTLLTGRVTRLTNGEWLGNWSFQFDGINHRYDGDANNVDNYIAMSLDQVAELLAAKYAIAPVSIAEGGILMRLTGINSFVDYARAITYLESLAAIHHANVVHIQGDEIIVRLIADGMLPQLQQAFELDQRIQLQSLNHYQGEYPIVMDYVWPSASAVN